MKPIVAIIGRPNVGKSTLFNRIVGGRRAVIGDVAGVTRDRHYGPASWDGREFLVVDTAGFALDAREGLERKIQEQVDVAVTESDCILFLVDGKLGLHPEEKALSGRLRKSGKSVFVAVNKIDHPSHQDRLADFYSLSENLQPISAEHGIGVNDLLDQIVGAFSPEEKEPEQKKLCRVAIIGRPNVGKSSLLNRLLGEERVVVHEEPGTTRDAIDTKVSTGGRDYLLIDTAGIRRKGKWSSDVERVSVLGALRAIERSDVCLLILDVTQGVGKQDAHVAGAAFEAKKGLILIWNKWDLKGGSREKYQEEVAYKLKFLKEAPLLTISAKTGTGCPAIWPAVKKIYDASGKRFKTKEVNDVLERLVRSHNPPSYRGKPLRFSYATQVGVFPPQFAVFTNFPEAVPVSYERYIIGGFRETFGLAGAPLAILFRKKT